MTLLPDFDGIDDELIEDGEEDEDTGEEVYDVPREYEIDFKTGRLTGKIVEGVEAIKVWIWLCLHTERYRYAIHDWDYGVEFEPYIGRTLDQEDIDTDIKKEVEDALYVNPWITEVTNWQSSMDEKHDKLHLVFTAVTDFGETEVDEFV